MGKFRSLDDTPERLAAYRTSYGIPDNVGVSYCHESDLYVKKGNETMIIHLVTFVKGGVRVLMSRLLTNFLRHFRICLN